MEIKTVNDLMKFLILIKGVPGNTEFVFYADNGDGTACMMDRIELSLNGDYVQLLMRRDD